MTGLYNEVNWEKATKLFQGSQNYTSKSIGKFPSTCDILNILGALGTVGLIIACPKAASGMAPLLLGKKKYRTWQAKKVFNRLASQKDLTIAHNPDGSDTIYITEKGLERALTYRLDTMKLKPRKWDGKWRAVIFDIPHKNKRFRDLFRRRLQQLRLYQLQKSVFVSPYPCFDEIDFLRELYNVSVDVEYLLIEKIEHDEKLKQYFDLD
jgi:hypothetical protein